MTYNIGDKVRIVKYGHLITCYPDFLKHMPNRCNYGLELANGGQQIDISPDVVGQEGIITKRSDGQYSLEGPHKVAWYNDDQLELVEANQVFKKEGV